MNVSGIHLQDDNFSLAERLRTCVTENNYTRFSICAAYATAQGVIDARALFDPNQMPSFRWIFGLDDLFTETRAVRLAQATANSDVRVCGLGGVGRRFHPKFYILDNPETQQATLFVGSNNLTRQAWQSNAEVFVELVATTQMDFESIEQLWIDSWNLATDALEDQLEQYEARRAQRQAAVQSIKETLQEPPPSEVDVLTTITTARKAWIEVGRNTSDGNQLDIVAQIGRFFGFEVNPDFGDTHEIPITSETGTRVYAIRFTNKSQWRFTNIAPGFLNPLRQPPDRSPFFILFERTGDAISMRTVLIDSAEGQALRDEAQACGTLRRSINTVNGRDYGWS